MKTEIIDRTAYFEGKFSGEANFEGFKTFFEQLLSHKRWRPGNTFLGDLTAFDTKHLTKDEVREIANLTAIYKKKLGPMRCALLVESHLGFGLVRMWMTFVDNSTEFTTDVFMSKEKAMSWLLVENDNNSNPPEARAPLK